MKIASTISVPVGRARFSSGEFLGLLASGAFDDMAVELIEWELDRVSPPGNRHGLMQIAVVARLLGLLPETQVRADAGIDLDNDTIVGAVAAVLKQPFDDVGMLPADVIALVVEIAVTSRDRDLGLKRRLYAAAAIPTYWVIDTERAVIHVFDRPQGDDYLGIALVRFGEPLPVPGTDAKIVLPAA